ncbi:MAG TPA: thioredoxin TrxC [bacterium]|nr:thioredoxin TrxC [bacterium]
MPETVRCPRCGAPNRAPLEKINQGQARCGKCHAELVAPQRPIDTTDKLFTADVLQAELPVLVDFWADWCGPCKMMAPVLEQFAAKHAGRVKVVKLNTEHYPHTAAPYNVRSIPFLALFKNGRIAASVTGAMPLAQLEARLAGAF